MVNVSYHIPYSFMKQDVAVAWTIFYGIAGLKSLANIRGSLGGAQNTLNYSREGILS